VAALEECRQGEDVPEVVVDDEDLDSRDRADFDPV